MRKLTISNCTGHHILVEYAGRSQPGQSSCVILPSAATSIPVCSLRSHLVLSAANKFNGASDEEGVSVNAGALRVRFPLAFGAQWKVVKVEDSCPWRIYRSRVSGCTAAHLMLVAMSVHSKVSRRHHKLVILSKRNLASFLSDLPDSIPLSALTLPGTHDT